MNVKFLNKKVSGNIVEFLMVMKCWSFIQWTKKLFKSDGFFKGKFHNFYEKLNLLKKFFQKI
jgi:hypothetical protein